MDILNQFRQWVVTHWSVMEAQGIRLTLAGQTQQQTQKTNQLYLYAQDERYEACINLWEFGHCDVEMCDMRAESSMPREEIFDWLHFEAVDNPSALNAMMGDILLAFRTKALLTEAPPLYKPET